MHIRDQVQLRHRGLPWKLPVIPQLNRDNADIGTQLNCD